MDRKAPRETEMKDDLKNASYVYILSSEQRQSSALSSNTAQQFEDENISIWVLRTFDLASEPAC